MDKKGVEITLNTVIVAAICLMVLVVVVLIFTNFFGKGVTDVGNIAGCKSMGNGHGDCLATADSALNCIYKYGGCGFSTYQGMDYCCFPK